MPRTLHDVCLISGHIKALAKYDSALHTLGDMHKNSLFLRQIREAYTSY